MSEIARRLRRKVFSNPQAGVPYQETIEWQAADEIERLCDVLRRLAKLDDELVCGKPHAVEDVIDYAKYIARAALGEKE